MKRRMTVAVIVILVAIASAAGYLAGSSGNQYSYGLCNQGGGSLVHFIVTVSYPGNWEMWIAEFASNHIDPASFDSVCSYQGNGQITVNVGLANYQGWNTIVVRAHELGSGGNLTATVSIGDISRSNSTLSSYGFVVTTVSFFE